jgi:hypothetical protein
MLKKVEKSHCVNHACVWHVHTQVKCLLTLCVCNVCNVRARCSLTSLPAAVGVAVALPHISILSVAPFLFTPPLWPSCTILLRLGTRSVASSQATSLSATPCFGTPCLSMASVLAPNARFASPDRLRPLLRDTPGWDAAGAATNISTSAAKLHRLVARILLVCDLIS